MTALFVAQWATTSFGSANSRTESLMAVEPAPNLAAPPVTDLEVAESSYPGRLDTPLSVDIASPDYVHPLVASDVALVSYTTAGDLPRRTMTHDEFVADASRILGLLPTLDLLEAQMPTGVFTDDIERQKAYIQELDQTAEITREGFDSFVVDRQHQSFVPVNGTLERIDPKMFIIHWTGGGYEDVPHFLRVLGSLRVQYFIDGDAQVHELFASDNERPAHALGANDFAQGVEIETGHFDEVNSPLYGYSAEQITQTVYLAVDFLRRNDLPVDRTTIVGHFAADLIFSNPYYDPTTGTFSQGRIRKFDPPEELMAVIVNKARILDRALSREQALRAPSAVLERVLSRSDAARSPQAAVERGHARAEEVQSPQAAVERWQARAEEVRSPQAAKDPAALSAEARGSQR